jgi:RNA polymerase sigma factor (sigma-70 family)
MEKVDLQQLALAYLHSINPIEKNKLFTQIVNQFKPLFIHLLNKYSKEYSEDILQDCYTRVLYCLNIYNPEVNNSFKNFCLSYIREFIIDKLRVYTSGGLFSSGSTARRAGQQPKIVSIYNHDIEDQNDITDIESSTTIENIIETQKLDKDVWETYKNTESLSETMQIKEISYYKLKQILHTIWIHYN